MTDLGDDIEQIMLNAIRWRDQRGNAGTITKEDRRWLLRYIDRHVGAPCPHCSSHEHIMSHAFPRKPPA